MEKTCTISDCNKNIHAKGLCKRHYEINRIYGSPYRRTTRDRNEIAIKDGYAEIIIYNSKCLEIARTIIDIEDIDRVKDYKWHFVNKQRYIKAKMNGKYICLHRFLLNCTEKELGDHINHNVLDNRKDKLRSCTYQGNAINKGLSKNNTSGYPGVTWHKRHGKWMASLQLNRKLIFLGYYEQFEDAKAARIQGEKQYYKEFAPHLCGVM